MTEGVSIIIPTFNGGEIFKKNIEALASQQYSGNKELIIIDSGSTDGTPELALEAGASVQKISPKEFHHSRTRNEGVKLAQYPIVVLLVQDAVPASDYLLTNLVKALEKEPGVVAAYGRPLPQADADIYARFEVEQYSEYLGSKPLVQKIKTPELKSINAKQLLRLARIHNVCAAYRKEFLQANPFPDVIYAEDLAWGLSAVRKGYGINYVPDIEVYHSHNRPPEYRFRRALVETIVCSEMFGKADTRIPLLTATEINDIFKKMDTSIDKIKSEIKENKLKANLNFFSNFTDLRGSIFNRFKQYLILFTIHKKIINIFEDILSKNPSISVDEKIMVVDQIAANLKGRLLGAVYVKYKFEGQIPKDISDMVLPNLTGV